MFLGTTRHLRGQVQAQTASRVTSWSLVHEDVEMTETRVTFPRVAGAAALFRGKGDRARTCGCCPHRPCLRTSLGVTSAQRGVTAWRVRATVSPSFLPTAVARGPLGQTGTGAPALCFLARPCNRGWSWLSQGGGSVGDDGADDPGPSVLVRLSWGHRDPCRQRPRERAVQPWGIPVTCSVAVPTPRASPRVSFPRTRE